MQPKQYLMWCAKQKKGLRVVKGSANLQKAYLEKSKEALRSMEANAEKGIDEWESLLLIMQSILQSMHCSAELA